jgi:hypothetical protein
MDGFMDARRFILSALAATLVLAAAGSAFANGVGDAAWDDAFERAYAAALADAPFEPSPLALGIVEAEAGRPGREPSPEAAARRILELSLCAESSLRFGASPQEARALIRARLRFDGASPSLARFAKELGKSLKASAWGATAGAAAGQGGFGGFGGRGRR